MTARFAGDPMASAISSAASKSRAAAPASKVRSATLALVARRVRTASRTAGLRLLPASRSPSSQSRIASPYSPTTDFRDEFSLRKKSETPTSRVGTSVQCFPPSLVTSAAAAQPRDKVWRLGYLVLNPLTDPPSPVAIDALKEGIEFRDVSFAYERQRNGNTALSAINFTLPVGRSVGLVGRVGSGKSTLAQLVPRLIDASSGGIFLDGQDIRKVALRDLRRLIGYVPQEPFLFSTSLKANLALGKEQCSSEELARATAIARLDRDLEIFPLGLDTVVGERGVTLSGGQKQRATLARALVMDPPVLILDDCLSSVDAQTEAEILHGLRAILKEKTCLIISHRISAVREADEILVLDEGAIIERGNHDELIRRGGVYAELWQQQRLSEELEQI